MAKYLVHKVNHCRRSIAPPVEVTAESIPALADELAGEFEGQYIKIELPGAYSKLYRVMADLKLKLV